MQRHQRIVPRAPGQVRPGGEGAPPRRVNQPGRLDVDPVPNEAPAADLPEGGLRPPRHDHRARLLGGSTKIRVESGPVEVPAQPMRIVDEVRNARLDGAPDRGVGVADQMRPALDPLQQAEVTQEGPGGAGQGLPQPRRGRPRRVKQQHPAAGARQRQRRHRSGGSRTHDRAVPRPGHSRMRMERNSASCSGLSHPAWWRRLGRAGRAGTSVSTVARLRRAATRPTSAGEVRVIRDAGTVLHHAHPPEVRHHLQHLLWRRTPQRPQPTRARLVRGDALLRSSR